MLLGFIRFALPSYSTYVKVLLLIVLLGQQKPESYKIQLRSMMISMNLYLGQCDHKFQLICIKFTFFILIAVLSSRFLDVPSTLAL